MRFVTMGESLTSKGDSDRSANMPGSVDRDPRAGATVGSVGEGGSDIGVYISREKKRIANPSAHLELTVKPSRHT